MTCDKLFRAAAIALLAIGPLILSGALFGQQPATPASKETAPTPKKTTSKETASKETAPKETAPKETAPKETAPKETALKETAPKETAPTPKETTVPPVALELETQADCHHGPVLRHEQEALTTKLAALGAAIGAKPAPANLDDLEKQQQEKTARLTTVNEELKKTENLNKSKGCQLGEVLTVGFVNLGKWKDDQPKNKPQDLVLVLDGRVMKGLVARGPYNGKEELEFDLKRLESDDDDAKANRDAWSALLRRSHGHPTINVGVALGGNPPYYGPATITFRVLPRYWGGGVAFLLLLLMAFFVLARRSDILRDGPSGDVGTVTSWRDYLKVWRASAAVNKKSFSLARCQMAWWFFIIVAAYIWIWMVTQDRDSLTNGALVLMGISAATGLGAVLVDSSKDDQRQPLVKEQTALNDRVADLSTQIAANPAPPNLDDLKAEQQKKAARLEEVKTALASLPSPPGPSEGFLLDILRDETGVSFHRFQMAGWTVVLGFVFIVAVYRTLAMPDFSATLLALMGISSGTYIGFKIANPPKQ